ncbi:MAG: hypothetical protein M1831_005340 [Alyxoria varia]|nr:MAG: hypothetical protein M1831_005340 [Alyxoria varia]
MPKPFPTTTQPPPHPTYTLTLHPADRTPHTLLITINRPHALNALPSNSHWEAASVLRWFDAEPSLRVAVITGAGDKAFCAGQDLAEQKSVAEARASGAATDGKRRVEGAGVGGEDKGTSAETSANGKRDRGGTETEEVPHEAVLQHPPGGFMGISRRAGKKPVIAAVNGIAFGGGFEIVLNCDIILASPHASFSLPEARVGLYAAAGGLSRLVQLIGLPLASEIALAGRTLSATEARDLRIVNRVSESHGSLVDEALEMARGVAEEGSPDAVVVSKSGLREGLEGGVEGATRRTEERWGGALGRGVNFREGVAAFGERRRPRWVNSKL